MTDPERPCTFHLHPSLESDGRRPATVDAHAALVTSQVLSPFLYEQLDLQPRESLHPPRHPSQQQSPYRQRTEIHQLSLVPGNETVGKVGRHLKRCDMVPGHEDAPEPSGLSPWCLVPAPHAVCGMLRTRPSSPARTWTRTKASRYMTEQATKIGAKESL